MTSFYNGSTDGKVTIYLNDNVCVITSDPENPPKKQRTSNLEGYKISDIPKTSEEQIARKGEVIKLIIEEEKRVLSV